MYANGCISYGPIPHSYSYVTEGSVHVSFLLLLLLLAFPRLPPSGSLLLTPSPLAAAAYIRSYVANCRREGGERISHRLRE